VTSPAGRTDLQPSRSSSSSGDLLRVTSSGAEKIPPASRDDPRVTSSAGKKRSEVRSLSEDSRRADKIIAPPVRRKDLCKLLGLNNEAEVESAPEGRIAQKVALLHTTCPVTSEVAERPEASKEPLTDHVRRKNLAKFLGVEATTAASAGTASAEVNNLERESSKERRPFGRDSLTR
jgi:hypothetical protein